MNYTKVTALLGYYNIGMTVTILLYLGVTYTTFGYFLLSLALSGMLSIFAFMALYDAKRNEDGR